MEMKRELRVIVLAVMSSLVLAACATTNDPAAQAANDPYESMNRETFRLNMKFDRHILGPAAEFYVKAVPEPARDGVHNFLTNLDLPVTFANDLLQGELKRAGQTVGRFGINSTLGLAGLFDPATKMGIPYHSEDFGQTLGVYGADEGPYLVLPLFGPDPPRDAVGQVADVFLDPFTYIAIREHFYWSAGRFALGMFDLRARNIGTMEGIERQSVDYYASVRSLYRQLRNNEIRNGKPSDDLPDF